MITADELAAMISQRAILKRAGNGWVGRCPRPEHEDRHPSFWVFMMNGHGMFQCKSCGWTGNEITWRRFIGEAAKFVPDRKFLDDQQQRRRREHAINAFYDRFPDSPPPPWF